MIPGFSLIPPLGSTETITFITNGASVAASTTVTITGVSIGVAALDRRVILAIHTRQSTVTAVTIGGIAAVIHAAGANPSYFDTTIVSAVVPTGTTATVVITKNNASSGTYIGVFRSVGSIDPPVASASSVSLTPDLTSSVTFGPPGYTGVVAISVLGNNPTTWTGATEVYDVADGGFPFIQFSAAIVQQDVATVTATKSTSNEDAMAGAVWS